MFLKQLCLVFVLFISQLYYAQEDSLSCDVACHCNRNLTPAGVMISHVHPKNEWMLSYRFMQMGMGAPIQRNSAMSELSVFNAYLTYTPAMKMDMHMFMAMVGVSDRLTAMVMLNYLTTSMDMSVFQKDSHHMNGGGMTSNSLMTMNTQGLGDVKLHLLYGVVKNKRSQLITTIGTSIPVGSIQQKGASDDLLYPNSRVPFMMQLGSGSLELLPGLTYVAQTSDLMYSAQVNGVIRLNRNEVGYRLGNEITVNAWLSYNWWKGVGSSIRFEGSSMSNIQGYDKSIYAFNEISANPSNYGGKRIQAYAGVTYQFDAGFIADHRFGLEYGVPIYQYVNGIQNKLNQTWMASWSYSF